MTKFICIYFNNDITTTEFINDIIALSNWFNQPIDYPSPFTNPDAYRYIRFKKDCTTREFIQDIPSLGDWYARPEEYPSPFTSKPMPTKSDLQITNTKYDSTTSVLSITIKNNGGVVVANDTIELQITATDIFKGKYPNFSKNFTLSLVDNNNIMTPGVDNIMTPGVDNIMTPGKEHTFLQTVSLLENNSYNIVIDPKNQEEETNEDNNNYMFTLEYSQLAVKSDIEPLDGIQHITNIILNLVEFQKILLNTNIFTEKISDIELECLNNIKITLEEAVIGLNSSLENNGFGTHRELKLYFKSIDLDTIGDIIYNYPPRTILDLINLAFDEFRLSLKTFIKTSFTINNKKDFINKLLYLSNTFCTSIKNISTLSPEEIINYRPEQNNNYLNGWELHFFVVKGSNIDDNFELIGFNYKRNDDYSINYTNAYIYKNKNKTVYQIQNNLFVYDNNNTFYIFKEQNRFYKYSLINNKYKIEELVLVEILEGYTDLYKIKKNYTYKINTEDKLKLIPRDNNITISYNTGGSSRYNYNNSHYINNTSTALIFYMTRDNEKIPYIILSDNNDKSVIIGKIYYKEIDDLNVAIIQKNKEKENTGKFNTDQLVIPIDDTYSLYNIDFLVYSMNEKLIGTKLYNLFYNNLMYDLLEYMKNYVEFEFVESDITFADIPNIDNFITYLVNKQRSNPYIYMYQEFNHILYYKDREYEFGGEFISKFEESGTLVNYTFQQIQNENKYSPYYILFKNKLMNYTFLNTENNYNMNLFFIGVNDTFKNKLASIFSIFNQTYVQNNTQIDQSIITNITNLIEFDTFSVIIVYITSFKILTSENISNSNSHIHVNERLESYDLNKTKNYLADRFNISENMYFLTIDNIYSTK